MKSRPPFQKIHFYLCSLIAFFLPIGRIVPIFIILLTLNLIVRSLSGERTALSVKVRPAILFCSLYLIYVVGMLYTSNIERGLFDLEVKLSILVFPIIFLFSPAFNGNEMKNIFKFFIFGCAAACLICLSRASYIYFLNGENHFSYMQFSILLHPSYFAWYLNVAIAILSVYFLKSGVKNRIEGVLILFLLMLFASCIFLLASKMGLVSLLVVLLILVMYLIFRRKKYWLGVGFLAMITLSCFLAYHYIERLSVTVSLIRKGLYEREKYIGDTESTMARIFIWEASIDLIKEDFLIGSGTGDAKDVMLAKYKAEGMTGAYEKQLNAHDQFLQTFVTLGFIGFSILLLNFFVPLMKSFREKDILLFLFIVLTFMNFLVESMFETQAGVMFYAFFNSLLFFKMDNLIIFIPNKQ